MKADFLKQRDIFERSVHPCGRTIHQCLHTSRQTALDHIQRTYVDQGFLFAI
jgi:hypothetical protein